MSMIETINYFDTGISAGFPSPAGDFISSKLNIHDYIVTNPSATFCVKVSGDSMVQAHIFSGDILVIDRSIKPLTGHIMLCVLDGEYLIKKLKIKNNQIYLVAANDKYKPILINKKNPFDISGVVIASIRKFI